MGRAVSAPQCLSASWVTGKWDLKSSEGSTTPMAGCWLGLSWALNQAPHMAHPCAWASLQHRSRVPRCVIWEDISPTLIWFGSQACQLCHVLSRKDPPKAHPASRGRSHTLSLDGRETGFFLEGHIAVATHILYLPGHSTEMDKSSASPLKFRVSRQDLCTMVQLIPLGLSCLALCAQSRTVITSIEICKSALSNTVILSLGLKLIHFPRCQVRTLGKAINPSNDTRATVRIPSAQDQNLLGSQGAEITWLGETAQDRVPARSAVMIREHKALWVHFHMPLCAFWIFKIKKKL